MSCRAAQISRDTAETRIQVRLSLDGTGATDIRTGVKMFDHFLSQVARHGLLDLVVTASGDDQHHVVEDVAICLGRALNEALGEKKGIVRMGHAVVPMDEAISMVSVDISGRGLAVISAPFDTSMIGDLESDLVRHFFQTLAAEGRITLHARIDAGVNDHHKAESLFKALGRALDAACAIDPRRQDSIPSTKNVLEH
ncbi:MAG: imidazoleglycerol-phosphate dehydratase HisB [Dehalococcoidia bacterium]|nr:imidazoleglycerol-phosphate dehydratase HisB [Dehalococcoidia bacterium]